MRSEPLVVLFHLLGFVLLMQGLFPYSSSTPNIANRSCFDSQEGSKRHIILLVIDALRVDYVFAKNNSYYLKSITRLRQDGKAVAIKLRTHTPTVTLPRLKAILTGTVPSFWDVLFNYNSSQLEIDNLLSQYKRRYPQKKIVFYGDDTWVKLFPDHSIFHRSFGLQSFFVSDFKEVDLNVTRGLYSELNEMNDWDMLIVHYLGLDHIGHAFGAFNRFVEEKLAEMDEIIETVFSKVTTNDLVIITGDHGMVDQGGHGGSSDEERYVPAVFLSHQLKDTLDDPNEYLQIDLTPTLSALFEIAIPFQNLGILIESLLKHFYHVETQSNLLKCLIDDNRRQLSHLLSQRQISSSFNDLRSIRDQAMSISNEQDSKMLILSIILFCSSTILLWFHLERISFLSIIFSIVCYFFSNEIFLSLGLGAVCFCIIAIVNGNRTTRNVQRKEQTRLSTRLLRWYPVFHLISLFSSSFIEEEHQTWYYLLSTYLLIRTIEDKSPKTFFMLVLSRVIRSWNQTGNKWLNVPVIGDFLNASENGLYLFVLHLVSSMVFAYLLNKSKRYSMSYILPIIVLIYRWNLVGSFSLLTPLFYYGLLIFLIVVNGYPMENLLFSLLYILCRPHNSLIIVVHMIFYQLFDVFDACLAFLFSQSAFFHLGNSNSFVTIDISSGFVGVPTYLPIVHGLLIYLFTYGLSIVWLLKLSKEERSRYLMHLVLINSLFVFCVFLQRYHLFVWTVFAPKLFYLCAQTAFNFFLFL